jgi:hypothetical protein
MAIFDGKQYHSSLETSALLGSTSRGAALCEGAASLRTHRSLRAEGALAARISARTIASRVTTGVRQIADEGAFTPSSM